MGGRHYTESPADIGGIRTNVNFEIFEDRNRQFKTARERVAAHSTDPVCAGCHRLTDPMGLALAIDTSGVLDGQPFTDVFSLGQAIGDRPWLTYIVKRFAAHGYRVPDLLREIASSQAFYAVSAPSGSSLPQSTFETAGIQKEDRSAGIWSGIPGSKFTEFPP